MTPIFEEEREIIEGGEISGEMTGDVLLFQSQVDFLVELHQHNEFFAEFYKMDDLFAEMQERNEAAGISESQPVKYPLDWNVIDFSVAFGYITDLSLPELELETLPETIQNLQFLETLDISYNKITQIPPIGTLRYMRRFNAGENQISKLEVASLPQSLIAIDLRNNNLEVFPL